MEIKDRRINGLVVIKITGDIDAITAPKITQHIRQHIEQGNIKLITDLYDVPYTSSAGLRVLLAAVKETRFKSGDMRLANIQEDVLKVLKLTGFTNILKIFPDVDSAVQSYT
jgi:anti-sigma B factor antagonist